MVRDDDELAAALPSARAEAQLAFGDPTVFLEKLVPAARHVEVQVIADGYGTVWAVGVRDCSLQRRHQKVLEESASTVLDAAEEQAIRDAAVRLAPPRATATPARWSSWSTRTPAASCSWRSTPGCRSSIR